MISETSRKHVSHFHGKRCPDQSPNTDLIAQSMTRTKLATDPDWIELDSVTSNGGHQFIRRRPKKTRFGSRDRGSVLPRDQIRLINALYAFM